MNESLEEPLLDRKEALFDEEEYTGSERKTKSHTTLYLVVLLLVNVVVLSLNGIAVSHIQKSLTKSESKCAIQAADSPAAHTLTYKEVLFRKYAHHTSVFSKKPGLEVDAAWHELLEGMNIRVSEEWLSPYGAKSVAFADGSGYLVQLAVYHELHCLKKLKRWIYREHYYGNWSQSAIEEEESHAEHCLELLREATLCRGDTTLTTFQWGGIGGGHLETEYPIPHKCVDSERVMDWSKAHSVDISDKSMLKQPGQES